MKFYLLILITAVLIIGCKQSENKQIDKNLFASVNGVIIFEQDIKGKNPEDVINSELLYQEAVKKGADKEIVDEYNKHKEQILNSSGNNNKTKHYLEYYRKKLITDYFIYKMLVSDQAIDDKTLYNFYQDNLFDFESITVDEVIFTDKELAKEFLKKIKSGEKFEELKKEYFVLGKGRVDVNIIYDPIYKKKTYRKRSGHGS